MNNTCITNNSWIRENGVRPGDKIKIFPLYGKEDILTLDRTTMDFVSHYETRVKTQGTTLFLPFSGKQAFHFQIRLIQNRHNPEIGRYLLKSLNQTPFKINGIYAKEVFLFRGVTVDLGNNQLVFNNIQQNEKYSIIDKLPLKVLMRPANILLEGETGTGKTRLAKMIHDASGFAGQFVHLNLAAFSYNLLESELFGHVKGSFTGASYNRTGSFELAKNGTLFLDEIDSLPMDIQVKLLLVLESMCIRPVGAEFTRKIKTRIIFAAGRSLQDMVEEKAFRKDLFYRINRGYHVKLKPLRDNADLIENLIYNFLNKNKLSCSKKIINFYKTMPWPGNIRQLLGHLERKMLNAKGNHLVFDEEDEALCQTRMLVEADHVEHMSMEKAKRCHAYNTFVRLDCNYDAACQRLKISKTTLRRLLDVNEQGAKLRVISQYKHSRQSH